MVVVTVVVVVVVGIPLDSWFENDDGGVCIEQISQEVLTGYFQLCKLNVSDDNDDDDDDDDDNDDGTTTTTTTTTTV